LIGRHTCVADAEFLRVDDACVEIVDAVSGGTEPGDEVDFEGG
jgi:hypothetical protein